MSDIYTLLSDKYFTTAAAVAAAAKSLQSCPTLCDPVDGSPPGPAVPGILQARTPGTAGPGGLPSMGSHRLGHD